MDMFSAQAMIGFKVPYAAEMRPTLVNVKDSFNNLIEQMKDWPYVLWDNETTGLSFMHKHIVGVTVSSISQPTFYIPLRHRIGQNLDPSLVLPQLYQIFKVKPVVAHNIKFDYNFMFTELERLGIDNPEFNASHDTMIMHQILRTGIIERHALDILIKKYFNVDMLQLKYFTEGGDFSLVAFEDALLYACGDAYWLGKLFEFLKPLLVSEGLVGIYKIEMDCLKAFAEMERVGLPINQDGTKQIYEITKNALDKTKKIIFGIVGVEFNIDAPEQLAEVLYHKMKIPSPSKQGTTGVYSTDRSVLEERKDFPLVAEVLKYRDLSKMISSFLIKANTVVCEDGRLHTTFKQCHARSGRVATSDGIGPGGINPHVNAQQFPKPETEEDVNFRQLIEAPKDYYCLAADYKQIEYQLMACMAGEIQIVEALKGGADFHKQTASMMFKKPIDQVSKLERSKGKTINFGMIFGLSVYSLARKLNISVDEAKKLFQMYFEQLKNVQKFIEQVKKQAWETGEVRTAFGRKRDFSNLRSQTERKIIESILRSAFNTVIQGSAADINKMGLGATYCEKQRYGKKMLMALNTHDELLMFVHNSIPVEEAVKVIKFMEQDYSSRGWMKFGVSVKKGRNYGMLQALDQELPEDDSILLPQIVLTTAMLEPECIVMISTGEFANFSAIKRTCSPVKKGSYRVVLKIKDKKYLLPESFSFNPTKKLVEFLQNIEGVEVVSLHRKGVKNGIS